MPIKIRFDPFKVPLGLASSCLRPIFQDKDSVNEFSKVRQVKPAKDDEDFYSPSIW
jgi:hypothetical protein